MGIHFLVALFLSSRVFGSGFTPAVTLHTNKYGLVLECLACARATTKHLGTPFVDSNVIEEVIDVVILYKAKDKDEIPVKDGTSLDDSEVEDESRSVLGNNTDITGKVMVQMIGFYKNWISPLLPPACRFTPTCSQYGVQGKNDPSRALKL